MSSISNDGLSGQVSKKRPFENGDVPKYKPRKVSAIRDFPPGCGLNDVPSNLKPQENGGTGTGLLEAGGVNSNGMANAVVANGVKSSIMANLREADGFKNFETVNCMEVDTVNIAGMPKFVKLDGIKNSEIANAEGSGMKNPNIDIECRSREAINSTVDIEVAELLDALVEKVTTMAMDGCLNVEELIMEIRPLEVELPNEVDGQTLEAVDKPVELDVAESLDGLVGKVTKTVDGFSNGGEEVFPETDSSKTELGGQTMLKELNEVEALVLVPNSIVEDAKPVLAASASVDEALLHASSQPSSSCHGSVKLGTCARPKDKFRPRRVSAVRDFPPRCGTNNPLPTEEKQQMATSGNSCLDGVEKVEVEPEATMLMNGSDRVALGDVLIASEEKFLDGVNKVGVKTETAKALNDGVGEGPPGETLTGIVRTISFEEMTGATVMGELVKFEECNRDLQDSNTEKIKARRAILGSGTMSKADLNEDTRAPVGIESILQSLDSSEKAGPPHSFLSSGDELHRQVVHGLIAAPYCPWRKGKVDSNNSYGGTSAGKARKNNLSGQQNSKAVALNSNLKADCLGRSSTKKTAVSVSYDADENRGSLITVDKKYHDDECLLEITPVPVSQAVLDDTDVDTGGPVGKEIVVYSPDKSDEAMPIVVYSPDESDEARPLRSFFSLADEMEREVVHGLVAAPYCPWRKGKVALKNTDDGISGGKMRKQKLSWKQKTKAVAKKYSPKINFPRGQSMKQKEVPVVNDADGRPGALMLTEEEGHDHQGDSLTNSPAIHKTQDFDVSLPPFGFNHSSQGDARNKVRETLRLFHTICRKLLQKEEANLTPDEEGNSRQPQKKSKRIDLLSAKIIKDKGKEVNTDKQIFGHVPGVEVGDEFQYRVELAVVGIHRLYQAGIDWMKYNGIPVATSIVASGAYSDDLKNADVLIYSGQGGNIIGKTKRPEDQKLERGNLALRNSISAETPVRVVRGWKEKVIDPVDSKTKTFTIYVYDGIYTVKKYWTEKGPHGKLVFMFELWRNPGQPELAWKELKSSNKFNTRPGVCVSDISEAKESFPICAVNTLTDEKPPPFNYISKMMYPDWYLPIPPEGCNCTGRCTDSKKCLCAVRNGGEIPYNRNGAIVEVKPLVYECGPSCKCPPSCYNRVSQRGIKFKLEIFKTESRGWGIRSLNSIPSGSFICEYAGELLEDKEAEQRIGNDEYLFDIGQNCNDFSLKPEENAISAESLEEIGYTIDAAQYGNVGRFINHSCSPNLYAQNVIYDHDNKRIPHVMLFAGENIPPLQELTYHYNYTVDQVRDSNGNIKIKKCYCGSAECTGRMY